MNVRTIEKPASAGLATQHPLAPLTPSEIAKVVSIVQASPLFNDKTRFEVIELLEPSKALVRALKPGQKLPREARANIFTAGKIGVARLKVSLDEEKIISAEELPDQRPMIQLEQFLLVESTVRADPRFAAGCAKRGITDMSKVCIDPWSAGSFDVPGEEGRHLCHVFAWVRLYKNENFYAHPIEGLNAVIDLNSGEVIRVDDYGVVPIPMNEVNYEAQFLKSDRQALKPIDVVQPEGVNFAIEDGVLTWDKWQLVVGFNAREGLTLHDIRYDDRPVIYRASIVEMLVPYGSPDNGHFRKHVFDIGEYGLGKLVNSLKLGCDCLGAIEYLDVNVNMMDGSLMTIENAICIHEEDSGLLWKHTDFRTDRTEVRRARKLVVSMIATVGNYEYAFYWYLHLDGAIEFEMKATGIINTVACEPGKPGKYATEVSPGVAGQIHQHIFCARLDMAIDGDANSVIEQNTYAETEDSQNRYGNAYFDQPTLLKTELEAGRRINPETMRYWKIINPNVKNHVGQPTAYKLEAKHTVTPFVRKDSFSGRRAGFVQNHVWVTAFDPEERYPGGDFMNHSKGGGLSEFVKQNRPIENADIVLWHVFGLHHTVRTEDFPVQPCVMTGFKLMPAGFFDRNPTIDLPPAANKASCCANANGDGHH
ncbi:MAG TPA: primary-amine oxidase [Candidatus Binataceae bacterium]|nr:primary-amine oxidase [Candidatus Binataceae bacterium]